MLSDTKYSFSLKETSSNVVFWATTDDVESKCKDLYCFLSCKNSSIPGYGYINSCGVQISSHIDIEFCPKIDKKCYYNVTIPKWNKFQ